MNCKIEKQLMEIGLQVVRDEGPLGMVEFVRKLIIAAAATADMVGMDSVSIEVTDDKVVDFKIRLIKPTESGKIH